MTKYEKIEEFFLQRSNNGNYKPKITVDASNGVGAKAMVSFMQYLNGVLDITLVNDGSTGILNYQVRLYNSFAYCNWINYKEIF